MTDEEIDAALHAVVADIQAAREEYGYPEEADAAYAADIRAITQIAAQAKRNAALVEIARAVEDMPLGYSHEAGNYCVWCDNSDYGDFNGQVQHAADCPVTKARALLSVQPEA